MANGDPPAVDLAKIAGDQAAWNQWVTDTLVLVKHGIAELKAELSVRSTWQQGQEVKQATAAGISQGRASILMFLASAGAITAVEFIKPALMKLVGL